MKFDNYLFRCSSLGKLMVGLNPPLTPNQEKELARLQDLQCQGKITEKQTITLGELLAKKHTKNDLSKTSINYLNDLYKQEFFSRNKAISTKYTDKGIQCEENSISLYTDTQKILLHKNKQRFKNKHFTGEPDNIKGKIRDMKTSWDFTTFPIFDNEIPNKDYYWQLQGYMDLTNTQEAELIYCLVDTPIKMVEDELRRLDWKAHLFDINGNAIEKKIPLIVETVSNLIYTWENLEKFCQQSDFVHLDWFEDFKEISPEHRIKIFEVKRDDKDIELMKKQVIKAREYLNSLTA